jgi:hypothetical protein
VETVFEEVRGIGARCVWVAVSTSHTRSRFSCSHADCLEVSPRSCRSLVVPVL